MPSVHRLFGSAEEVETAFYEALAKGDIQALMDLWADEEEVVCIHPNGGRLVGLAAIRQSYEEIFSQGVLPITLGEVRVLNTLTNSIHHVIELLHVPGSTSQREMNAAVMATNVYIKYPQGWRIVLHHASPLAEWQTSGISNDRPDTLH